VADKPKRRLYTPTPSAGPDDRPTARPDFDLEAFARKALKSDSQGAVPASKKKASRSLKEPEPDSASALLRTLDASIGKGGPQRRGDDRAEAMRRCLASGNYATALTMADLVLAEAPSDPVALDVRAQCRATLEDVYTLRLGSLSLVPVVVVLPENADGRVIDHRTGFILSLVDGSSTLENIVDMSGMPRFDALRLLLDLVQGGIVAVREPKAGPSADQ
jgi:hypothetical protein